MIHKPRSRAVSLVVALATFAFAALVLSNVWTLFGDQAINVGPSAALAAAAPDRGSPPDLSGHREKIGGRYVCICGPPYECSNCFRYPQDRDI